MRTTPAGPTARLTAAGVDDQGGKKKVSRVKAVEPQENGGGWEETQEKKKEGEGGRLITEGRVEQGPRRVDGKSKKEKNRGFNAVAAASLRLGRG